MKSITDMMVNEKRNFPYRVALIIGGKTINVTMTVDNINEADLVDQWLEEEKDNSIYGADGGPNDVEI